MLQDIFQNTGIIERSQPGRGSRWGMPGVWSFPCFLCGVVEVYFTADGTYDDPQKIRHLMMAIFAQACRDAAIHGQDRQEAIGWLQTDGAIWAQGLGLRIKQEDINRWISGGCQKIRKGAI